MSSRCATRTRPARQVLVNFGLLGSVAGVRAVYVFGILVSAVGMSLFLARSLGQVRVHEAENARKTLELARAREVQLSMLPRALPAAAGLELAAETHTAAEVGGDYYDARATGDGSLLVAFGDATAREVVERLGAAAAAFRGTRPQDDDVTFFVVRVA